MKEIDQRNKNEILIKCNCGGDHFLEFGYFVDKSEDYLDNPEKIQNGYKHFYISFIETYHDSFWWRLKRCFKFLFKYKDAELCYSSIGITSKDMKNIIKLFEKYEKVD